MRTRHTRVVVAVRSRGETGVWSRGVAPDSVFEIGSITKTFTATLLADMAREGLVAFDDPVARHLPVAPPVVGREITLEDLATHTLRAPAPARGAAAHRATRATARTRTRGSTCAPRSRVTRPKRAPGGRAVYSNYGMGLLGYALAQRAGMTYGELVRERITGPLGLQHTALDTPGPGPGPHAPRASPTPPWNLADLAGAGGLRSTAADLLAYLALHARRDGPLADAAREARRPRAKLGAVQIGLAWLIVPADKGLPLALAARRRPARGRHGRLPHVRRRGAGHRHGRRRAREPGPRRRPARNEGPAALKPNGDCPLSV